LSPTSGAVFTCWLSSFVLTVNYAFISCTESHPIYSHWLTKRPDTVMAEGKGWMQTYWCEPVLSAEGKSIAQSEEKSEF
jgi:hypothetical protein